MKELLEHQLHERKLLILGFGKEGQSTFRYIRKHFPDLQISIADRNPELPGYFSPDFFKTGINTFFGSDYLNSIHEHQFIIKSPGVAIPEETDVSHYTLVTSQTRLMLEAYHRQIIGITGTKGKSTTSSLIRHLLDAAGIESVLVGNIGMPPFDYLDQLTAETRIVFEMSSHQLEDSISAPHISVLLNLYPEHLDRYDSLKEYYDTKMRILTGQQDGDVFIYNEDIPEISHRIRLACAKRKYYSFSSGIIVQNGCFLRGREILLVQNGKVRPFIELSDEFALKGQHNRMNMMAAILAARIAGAGDQEVREGLASFKGLEHRLEYVGEYQHIRFYNDSIATIPEATIAAINALPDTDTVILGGHDRMLDYSHLVDFLAGSQVRNFIFLGKAGARMYEIFRAKNHQRKNLIVTGSLAEAFESILAVTLPGKICLLSPAAASYDSFTNFEERGMVFKKLASSL